MYKWEGFIRSEQGTPAINMNSLEKSESYSFMRKKVPLDQFTPLSLRLANVNDGRALVVGAERNLKLYNSKRTIGLESIDDNYFPIGYIALPRIGFGIRGYQLVAKQGNMGCIRNEIPEGIVSGENSNELAFNLSNNAPSFRCSIDSLIPIGKVMISRARHVGELQNELKQRISLALRQRLNLEAVTELPEENSFIHAGDYIENSNGSYSNLLVLSGNFKK